MPMKGRCIMMCAGEFHPMKIEREPGDWVIAVDGGLKYLEELGVEPDFLLGDFDSLGAEYVGTVEKYRAMGEDHFRQFPVAKDDTDTMAAARLGISRGYREFLIYGGLGGRLDHTMANLQTMVWILRNGGRAFMLDRDTCVTVIGPGEFRIPEDFTGTVSLFALDECLENVTIRGMKYEVENAAVRNDYPLGCSNETVPDRDGTCGSYSIGKGTGLLIMTRRLINKGGELSCADRPIKSCQPE